MKILIVNKFLFPKGGSETYIFKIGKQLEALGNQVQYFGMSHKGNIVGNALGVYTQDMDFHSPSPLAKLGYAFKTVNSPDARKKMLAVLHDFQPDVVHLNNFNYQLTPSVICAAKEYERQSGRRLKIVYTAHDYQLVCPNHMMLTPSGRICAECAGGSFFNCFLNSCIHSSRLKSLIGSAEGYYWKFRNVYSLIDAVICPSAFMESKLSLSPVLRGKTVVMHNFTQETEKKPVKKQPYALYFGRFSFEKGVDTLIEAARVGNFRLVCAGSGELEDKLNACPNIENVGFKTGEELEKLIRNAACSVYPSVWYENCPFSVMESISLGTPVIGADIGGIPELIDNGKTGFLFEPGNAAELAEKVSLVISNGALSQQMSAECFKKRFDSAEDYCKKLLEIYTR